ncbi:MAG: Restriction [Planctomycetota bacterium]|nr:MAG: Restriction [Planctomycetota bacterium]
MGGINLRRMELVTTTGEIVGHKSGLALTREELSTHVPKHLESVWYGDDSELVRIRSEEFEEVVGSILHGVGNIEAAIQAPVGIRIWKKYRNDPMKTVIVESLLAALPEYLENGLKEEAARGDKKLDPTPFLERAGHDHGKDGLDIGAEILLGLNADLHRSPWTSVRRVEWKDVAELRDLFKSESLETLYGDFLDQRFIDYLDQNFGDIGSINWRKFEALACEFFKREGYEVQIGEGRDDGNIDARVWRKDVERSGPPTMLVQCKREKKKVGKVVVKALWADVVHEGANSGLVVTTSALAPGAMKTCTARGYNIDQANRTTLRTWISAMRTPFTGVFLGP